MKINFEKYQGTGNDFILIDNRKGIFPADDIDLITQLCDRKFGIGSDGLMLFQNIKNADFKMIFFNPDGSQSLCGNGSRCAIAFAHALEIIKDSTSFITTDGRHEGKFINNQKVSVSMRPVTDFEEVGQDMLINTGSPHYVKFVDNVDAIDIEAEGRKIRYSENYIKSGGTNVNFVQVLQQHLKIRTYERGVEAETLSCGTGVTAVAIAAALKSILKPPYKIETKGGFLEVSFENLATHIDNIWLAGPAKKVFSGSIEL